MVAKKITKRRSTANDRQVRVGVDTGGTFTDFVYESPDGRDGFEIFKLASTPLDASQAIRAGLMHISEKTGVALKNIEVVHGTTVGTNALLERRGARMALVTTRGFEDVLAIGRQARPELYNLNAVKPPPLVADELRFGVRERVTATGEILEPLNVAEVTSLIRRIKKARVESVAICLLFSFVDSAHEEKNRAGAGQVRHPSFCFSSNPAGVSRV